VKRKKRGVKRGEKRLQREERMGNEKRRKI
jgi:hypothetical protein